MRPNYFSILNSCKLRLGPLQGDGIVGALLVFALIVVFAVTGTSLAHLLNG
jgi:hypothetical protein